MTLKNILPDSDYQDSEYLQHPEPRQKGSVPSKPEKNKNHAAHLALAQVKMELTAGSTIFPHCQDQIQLETRKVEPDSCTTIQTHFVTALCLPLVI